MFLFLSCCILSGNQNPPAEKDILTQENLLGQQFLLTEKGMSYRRLLDAEGFQPDLWKQLLYHREKWVSPAMETTIQILADRW